MLPTPRTRRVVAGRGDARAPADWPLLSKKRDTQRRLGRAHAIGLGRLFEVERRYEIHEEVLSVRPADAFGSGEIESEVTGYSFSQVETTNDTRDVVMIYP